MKKEIASKEACKKIREVFSEALESHPNKTLDWSDDNVLIEEFTDEWTWYMQGWKDSSLPTQSPSLVSEETLDNLINEATEFLKGYGDKGYIGQSAYIGAMVDFHLKKSSLVKEGEKDEEDLGICKFKSSSCGNCSGSEEAQSICE